MSSTGGAFYIFSVSFAEYMSVQCDNSVIVKGIEVGSPQIFIPKSIKIPVGSNRISFQYGTDDEKQYLTITEEKDNYEVTIASSSSPESNLNQQFDFELRGIGTYTLKSVQYEKYLSAIEVSDDVVHCTLDEAGPLTMWRLFPSEYPIIYSSSFAIQSISCKSNLVVSNTPPVDYDLYAYVCDNIPVGSFRDFTIIQHSAGEDTLVVSFETDTFSDLRYFSHVDDDIKDDGPVTVETLVSDASQKFIVQSAAIGHYTIQSILATSTIKKYMYTNNNKVYCNKEEPFEWIFYPFKPCIILERGYHYIFDPIISNITIITNNHMPALVLVVTSEPKTEIVNVEGNGGTNKFHALNHNGISKVELPHYYAGKILNSPTVDISYHPDDVIDPKIAVL